MSTFSGISTALSSLYAQRRAVDVTGQNIANANTEGYSRQRTDMQSVGSPGIPALFAVYDGAGGGVNVNEVSRVRDAFLEQRGRIEHSRSGYLDQRKASMDGLEQLTGALNDTGLSTQLADLWASFHDIANRPNDLAARSQLLQRAGTVTGTLANQSTAMGAQWSAQREQADTLAAEVNSTAAAIADLNNGIQRASQGGLPSNELQDKRDVLVIKLAELTGATVRNNDDGTADVYLGGSALVRGSTTNAVASTGATGLPGVAGNPVGLSWAADGRAIDLQGGKLAALYENLNTTIPDFSQTLDSVAAALASSVNSLHTGGFDLAGSPGKPLFTGTTAATIAVALTKPEEIAASGVPSATGNYDGTNATALANLAKSTTGPDNAYRTMVVRIGTETQTATQRSAIQTAVTAAADSARDSVSGVNLDEEMANMLAYQRAYEGASRLMSTIDSMLDTIINRMGA
jgi:flagellar hook-associated protein 1 FlgK